MPKVSFLVPVYNVSAYIGRCARSLFEQTFDDIEYIFVNDCTPDDSMERLEAVIEQYPERAGQVKIINQEQNQGPGTARNVALLAASGEYVCCVDSDDYVDADMVDAMYAKAVAEGADIVVADAWFEYAERTELSVSSVQGEPETDFSQMLNYDTSSSYLWDKMIRREFWLAAQAFSPEGLSYSEDWFVLIQLYFHACKIVKVNRAFYHYTRSNVNSITHRVTLSHFENMVTFWNLIDGFLAKEGCAEQYRNLVEQSKVVMKMGLMFEASYGLKRNYAPLFYDFELKYAHGRRLGEKWMLRCLHYKLYPLAQCVQFLVRLKNGKL